LNGCKFFLTGTEQSSEKKKINYDGFEEMLIRSGWVLNGNEFVLFGQQSDFNKTPKTAFKGVF
jgi:hypothetical protein